MADTTSLSVFQVEYVASVTGNIEVEAENESEAISTAEEQLVEMGFPHESDSDYCIDSITIIYVEEE